MGKGGGGEEKETKDGRGKSCERVEQHETECNTKTSWAKPRGMGGLTSYAKDNERKKRQGEKKKKNYQGVDGKGRRRPSDRAVPRKTKREEMKRKWKEQNLRYSRKNGDGGRTRHYKGTRCVLEKDNKLGVRSDE